MTESLHAVCPHCSAVNRIPADRPASEAKCGVCKAKLFTGEPIVLTSKTFDKHVERNDMPLIVDFWAPWCGPCRAMAPIFDRAAKELEPRARFAKVNVDEEPAIAARFGIRGIPTLIAFEKGKVAKQHAGLVDLEFLRRPGALKQSARPPALAVSCFGVSGSSLTGDAPPVTEMRKSSRLTTAHEKQGKPDDEVCALRSAGGASQARKRRSRIFCVRPFRW